jgi:hypothetical protein
MAGELQVISDFYDLMKYLTGRIEKFPRHHRYTLGAAMEGRLQTILALLVRAKYCGKPEVKVGLLTDANVELEVLRFQVRLGHELKALPAQGHGQAIRRMDEVGRQVGGWLRTRKGP